MFSPQQNLWVAVGNNMMSAYSFDGITWNQTTSNNVFGTLGNKVTFGGNKWIAGGEGAANDLAVSTNGMQWTPFRSNVLTEVKGIAYDP